VSVARISKLPPPPAVPVRAPAVNVEGETAITIANTANTPVLSARVRAPANATRAVLLCHPHPLYGGSMHSPVVLAIAKHLADRAASTVAALRFDFRGVGESGGAYDDGRGEVSDARAAPKLRERRVPNARITICGHSFGSWVGLRAAAAEEGVDRVALVAPSTRFFEFDPAEVQGFRGERAIFIGDQDEFCDVDEARALATKLGARIDVLEGFDHHFMKSRRKLAETAFPFIAPEAAS
jgi:alpha/beta superfamily hydrolase